ncbi:hypothetical protein ACFWQL_22485 [Amycolatopsis thermoflava]|uniref:hypothetical protein n=1 Tax=Amycolatopsis thermoflava TaxID=84480 RepID=UPI00365A5D6D
MSDTVLRPERESADSRESDSTPRRAWRAVRTLLHLAVGQIIAWTLRHWLG